jgi:signal transduction histidine kinase
LRHEQSEDNRRMSGLCFDMKIHKIEAAQRQLDTAISLFFAKGDPCSVITLAAASEELLSHYVDGLWVKNNQNNMFSRMYSEGGNRGLVLGSRTQFSQKLVNVTKNALKHADSEDEQHVSFDEEEMVIRLMLALMSFQIGAGRVFSATMTKFEAWLKEHRQNYLEPTK